MVQYLNKQLRQLGKVLGEKNNTLPPNSLLAGKPQNHASSALQQAILDKIETDYQQAEQYFNKAFPRPLVQFSLRGKSAGTAHLQLNKLRFNPVLLQENAQSFMDDVVPHEVSHLICFQLYGRVRPHGKQWQSIMLHVFGRPPKTTHQLNTQSVQGRQFDYYCGCGKVKLSVRRHNNVQRGKTQYRCKICQHTLQMKPFNN